jgi:hypothetical protein
MFMRANHASHASFWRVTRLVFCGVALFAGALVGGRRAGAAVIYMRSTTGAPWGLNGNENVMNAVFGTGTWQDLRYETAAPATVFSPANSFVFLEGGDFNATELETFLNANTATIQTWVTNGGRLLINSAPNEDNGMNMGFGVTLTYSDFSATGTAANPAHPIFLGPNTPVGTTWNGNWFSHAHVSGVGLLPVITDSTGDIILGEKTQGLGRVLFGGLTLPFFSATPAQAGWTPQPQVNNLHKNMVAYLAVPEPSAAVVMLIIAPAIFAVRRRVGAK